MFPLTASPTLAITVTRQEIDRRIAHAGITVHRARRHERRPPRCRWAALLRAGLRGRRLWSGFRIGYQ